MNLNPVGLRGIEFIEFASDTPSSLNQLFVNFGFSKTMVDKSNSRDLYQQNQINFLLSRTEEGHAHQFKKIHGPSISSMALRVDNAHNAFEIATSRGAKAAKGEYIIGGKEIPAIYGIGDSLIYFIDGSMKSGLYEKLGFLPHPNKVIVPDNGFIAIDHLTNNVQKGMMSHWTKFYKEIFGFTEVRYFDIRGVKTGLNSFALKSPCGTFCIPINEGTEDKSQINEYLEEYNGPGIQHLAFLTNDIVSSVKSLNGSGIETLSIDDEYYQSVFKRVPNVIEDHATLKNLQILVDGDEKGYLLQIFTKNVIGPIFIEIIQRKNHHSFGEGNFGALFRSIEKDQQKRGYLK